MRDAGLNEAIQAVGGVSELARRVGIAQPSISNWDKVPADRVLAVEEVTGINRKVLRPDLFLDAQTNAKVVDEVDQARAQEYRLLAALLVRVPGTPFLKKLAALRGDPSPLGVAHAALAVAADAAKIDRLDREFFDLFIGLGRGELLPYACYYLTGFLHERPLARLREDLAQLGIARVEGNCEPEDHAATLCEIMAGLISGQLDAPDGSDRRIFERHLAPWIGRFFADLERAESANFYRAVGALGRTFIEIEQEAFALPS